MFSGQAILAVGETTTGDDWQQQFGIYRNTNMKNSMTFEEQTEQIVEELLSDFIGKKLKPRAQCQYRSLAGTSSAGKITLLWGSTKFSRELY